MGKRAKTHLRIRTDDLARLFKVSVRTIGRRLSSGRLVFTGDPVVDFRMLVELVEFGPGDPADTGE